jgi:hypothetical protein
MSGEAGKKLKKGKSVSHNPEGDPDPNRGSDLPFTKSGKKTKKTEKSSVEKKKDISELDNTIIN